MYFISSLIFLGFVLLFAPIAGENKENCDNENCTLSHLENEADSRILSRQKRFIIFPDGSSLQLVFCVQTTALIPIGDIFLYGNTIALAWNLPADPKFLYMYKDLKEAQRRNDDVTKNILYVDSKGKVISKVPYKRPFIVNPAFAKRSIDANLSFKEKLKIKIDRKKMHERQIQEDYLNKNNLEDETIEFHRTTRVELYKKIEKLLTALGQDGRTCVLYKLCEATRRTGQGTFIQEFLRAVFTFPKGSMLANEEHYEYDKAHDQSIDCKKHYVGCEELAIKI